MGWGCEGVGRSCLHSCLPEYQKLGPSTPGSTRPQARLHQKVTDIRLVNAREYQTLDQSIPDYQILDHPSQRVPDVRTAPKRVPDIRPVNTREYMTVDQSTPESTRQQTSLLHESIPDIIPVYTREYQTLDQAKRLDVCWFIAQPR